MCLVSGLAIHLASFPPFVEPHFVGSAFVRESKGSDRGDDDKVYFFFSERAVEYDCDIDQVVARVARVCKVGGTSRGDGELWQALCGPTTSEDSSWVRAQGLSSPAAQIRVKGRMYFILLLQ